MNLAGEDLVAELAALERDGVGGCPALVGPFAMFNLIGVLQLACRHPDLGDRLKNDVLRPLADQFTDSLCGGFSDPGFSDALRQLIRDGWNPVFDVQR